MAPEVKQGDSYKTQPKYLAKDQTDCLPITCQFPDISFPVQPWDVRLVHGRRQGATRLRLKCDGTRAENRFRLSAKRTSPFKSAGGRQFSRLLAAEVCASAVVMLDTPCSEVVWRVLATHCILQFPLHFPSRASPCAITFQLESTTRRNV